MSLWTAQIGRADDRRSSAVYRGQLLREVGCASSVHRSTTTSRQRRCASFHTGSRDVQGGPAKVRPTYIFAGNIILVTFMHR